MNLTRTPLLIENEEKHTPDSHFLAIELHPKSQARVRAYAPPPEKGLQLSSHHVTLKYDVTQDEIDHFKRHHEGKVINFHGTHVVRGDGIHAMRVRGIPKELVKDKRHPHVTIAWNDNKAKPKDSNDLLDRKTGERLKDWIPLTGTLRLLPKTRP